MREHQTGFTLIELLIVVVIIGVLASIAIPKFAATKEKAYVASMKSDLRNLVTVEEAYLAEHATYSTSRTDLKYGQSARVTVTVQSATASGWAASAVHNGTTITCSVFYGNVTPIAPATTEGSPACQ
jgi:prepilin-type N-terminal cleavage/methylation domain-containing protein